MLLTTRNDLSKYEIVEELGLVRGSTVRARHIGRDILAGFKNVIGGEIKSYTKLIADSREEALERMKEDAQKLGADAIVSIRFETSTVMQGASEIFAYGTAVKIIKK